MLVKKRLLIILVVVGVEEGVGVLGLVAVSGQAVVVVVMDHQVVINLLLHFLKGI